MFFIMKVIYSIILLLLITILKQEKQTVIKNRNERIIITVFLF